MPNCNICGFQEFGSGPGNRMSATGKSPKCLKCFSLERHRALRQIYLKMSQFVPFESMVALQISDDKAIEPDWFHSREISTYGGANSIDIQNIDRLNQSYDAVICNHVLEHVANDQLALQELIRITSNDGFSQVSFPDPCRMKRTRDWGFPDEKQHGHYRVYGEDIEGKIRNWVSSDVNKIKVFMSDPVTEMDDICFFFTRSSSLSQLLLENLHSSKL